MSLQSATPTLAESVSVKSKRLAAASITSGYTANHTTTPAKTQAPIHDTPKQWAQRYASTVPASMAVVPVKFGTKKPTVLGDDWQDKAPRGGDVQAVGWLWRKVPHNIGLLVGPDHVVLDEDEVAYLRRFGVEPGKLRTPTAQTQSGTFHFWFKHPGVDLPASIGARYDADKKRIPRTGADVLTGNKQVLVEPSIVQRDDGSIGRYQWLDGLSIFDVEPAELPAALLTALLAIKTAPVVHEHAQTRTDGATVPLDVVESALQVIDPWAGGYTWWCALLMAVHSEHPDGDGLAVAEAWADGKPGEHGKPSEVARKWAGFDAAGGVTIATLLREAKLHGWIDPRRAAVLDDETDLPEYWRITPDDWHACPVCEPLYVERLSDGSIRSHHKWCRRATCPVWRKVKARRALGPAVGWIGVRTETVPADIWRSFRETARALLGMHWLGVPQADGSILAVYESADGEPLGEVLQVAAAAVLAIPKGRKISRPRRERSAKPSTETTETAQPAARAKPVERLAVLDWRDNRRLKAALDALAIPWTRRTHGAWETSPLEDAQVIGVRSAMAVLRLNAHLGTTAIQAQSDKPQASPAGVFVTAQDARMHELRHDRRKIRIEKQALW